MDHDAAVGREREGVTGIALLVGLQLLTCGADPLPAVRWLTLEEQRRRRRFDWETALRFVVLGAIIGSVLGKAAWG